MAWTKWGFAATAALVLTPLAGADETKRESAATSTQATQGGAVNEEQRQNTMPPPTSGIGPGQNTGGAPLGSDARTSGDKTATTSPGSSGSATSGSGTTASESTAATSGGSGAKDENTPSKHDNTDVIKKLWSANVIEIKAAGVAKDKAQAEGVKEFAERMETDHTEMRDALAKLAEKRNLELDEDAALGSHKAHLEQMEKLEGAQFDRHYTRMMVTAHEKDRKDGKAALKQAKQSGDHELAQVLQSADAKMAEHHRLAKSLDKSKGQRMGRRAGDATSDAASSTERGAERAGGAVERGADKTGDAMKRGADKTGDAMERAGEKTKDATR